MDAPNRPPDVVTYTEWEPIYGAERKRMVATAWTLLTVREYTEVVDRPLTGWKRKRIERWDGPRIGVAETADGPVFSYLPSTTIGRWEWEYRDRDRQMVARMVASVEAPRGA